MDFPTGPKDVATSMSLGVQAALQAGQLRLELTVPPTIAFGLFSKAPSKQILGDPNMRPNKEMLSRADREVAYLTVEMFQAYQDSCVCVFGDKKAAKAAEREWTRSSLRPRVLSRLAEINKKSGVGFSGGGAVGPPKVVIVCRPNEAAMPVIESLSDELGRDAVIVLLNPTASPPASFVPAFSLEENPHPDWKGGLLYHEYGGQWELGVAGSSGEPRVQGRSLSRPTLEEIDRGFELIESDTNWFSNKGAAAALQRRNPAPEAAT